MSDSKLNTYKVTLNFFKEIYTFYTTAVSEAKAKQNAFAQLTKKVNRSVGFINKYYQENQCSYKIEKVN